jgi:hypothetical protein
MLSALKVLEIRCLLNQELSQQAIADKLGVSRTTVNAIASGRRGLFGREVLNSRRRPRLGRVDPGVESIRCPGCGGLVYAPCLLCRSRNYRLCRRLAQQQVGSGTRGDHGPRRAA